VTISGYGTGQSDVNLPGRWPCRWPGTRQMAAGMGLNVGADHFGDRKKEWFTGKRNNDKKYDE
jgi:hypothetical protein